MKASIPMNRRGTLFAFGVLLPRLTRRIGSRGLTETVSPHKAAADSMVEHMGLGRSACAAD